MNQFFLLLSILLLSFSCSKESKLKFSPPMSLNEQESQAVDQQSLESNTKGFQVPTLKLISQKSRLSILNNDQVTEEIDLKVEDERYLRSKLLDILDGNRPNTLEMSDIFTYSISFKNDELFKIINNIKLEELNNYKANISTFFFLKNNKTGYYLDLDYRAGIENDLGVYVSSQLENEEEQVDGFSYGEKPVESYKFEVPGIALDFAFDKLTKKSKVIYTVDNFNNGEMSLVDWKSETLEKGSLLILSNATQEKIFFIPNGKSISTVLEDTHKVSHYKKINFVKLDEKILAGQILALVEPQKIETRGQVEEIFGAQSVDFVFKEGVSKTLMIQPIGLKHSIHKYREPQKVNYYKDDDYLHSRYCNVSREKIVAHETPLNMKSEVSRVKLRFNGRESFLTEMVKMGHAEVKTNKKSLLIILNSLPSVGTISNVNLSILSQLKEEKLVQSNGECRLVHYVKQYEGDGDVVREKVYIERFDSFRPSVDLVKVGIKTKMNLRIIE
ncbi:hypothetical protein [Halobacteriovorax marinus]|uniref:hypothetical protein n=1 Tax=Halobacteriovorax marinus TaxID=97084 RepID=UPI003A90F4CF